MRWLKVSARIDCRGYVITTDVECPVVTDIELRQCRNSSRGLFLMRSQVFRDDHEHIMYSCEVVKSPAVTLTAMAVYVTANVLLHYGDDP